MILCTSQAGFWSQLTMIAAVCLQTLPAGTCFLAVILGLFFIEVIGAPSNLPAFSMTAQEIVIILAALGSGVCILTTLVLPHLTYHMTAKKPTVKGLKRMNYLGLVRGLPEYPIRAGMCAPHKTC